MENAVKDETAGGLQTETAGGHVSRRSVTLSAMATALHFLAHPRKKAVVEVTATSGRMGRPERDRGVYRSPVEAGITGGFSLLMDSSNSSKRR
jgi:hypothetical protein